MIEVLIAVLNTFTKFLKQSLVFICYTRSSHTCFLLPSHVTGQNRKRDGCFLSHPPVRHAAVLFSDALFPSARKLQFVSAYGTRAPFFISENFQ